jgi:folate-binding protein YgfZ
MARRLWPLLPLASNIASTMLDLSELRELQTSLGARGGHEAAPADYGSCDDEYRALHEGAGVVDFADRTQIELRGPDRVKFLHALCTNDIRRLEPGSGCEAFLLDAKGHTLAHGCVFASEEALVFETVPRQADRLLAHLDRYLIREQVELENRGARDAELLVAGPKAADVLQAACGPFEHGPPQPNLAHLTLRRAAATIDLRRVKWIDPPAWLLSVPAAYLAQLWKDLLAAGASPCGTLAFERARIEAGYPWYGPDISDQNLPQEVNRDALAISFTKGCYLGQETVARIDALGHVNKKLLRVHLPQAAACAAGEELHAQGKKAGWITSCAPSPRFGGVIALAYVRREHCTPGTTLDSAHGPARVV